MGGVRGCAEFLEPFEGRVQAPGRCNTGSVSQHKPHFLPMDLAPHGTEEQQQQ